MIIPPLERLARASVLCVLAPFLLYLAGVGIGYLMGPSYVLVQKKWELEVFCSVSHSISFIYCELLRCQMDGWMDGGRKEGK